MSSDAGRAAQWLALPILAWGCTYLVVEKTLPAAPPLVLAELRAVFGGLLLLSLATVLGRPLIGRQWLWAAVLGVFNTAIVSVGIMVGTERIGPALSAVLTNSAPFFMALLGLVFLRERVRAATAAALVIGFSGVVVIVWRRAPSRSRSPP